jgi:hypothetical protein
MITSTGECLVQPLDDGLQAQRHAAVAPPLAMDACVAVSQSFLHINFYIARIWQPDCKSNPSVHGHLVLSTSIVLVCGLSCNLGEACAVH